jgi:hypothetical protein
MARPARPERSTSARPSRQLSRFYRSINSDMVFGTHTSQADVRFGSRLCKNSDVELARRKFVSITLNKKRSDLPVTVGRRKERKQFCAFSERARFHTAWVNNGSRPSLENTVAAEQSCRQFKADDGPLARFKLTGSALLDAPFSDGGRAGTKPSGFELLRPPPQRFEKPLLHVAREVRPQCERGSAQ